MLRIISLLSVVGIAVLFGNGCGQSCNAMAPYCALDVELVHEAWEPGAYSFRFTVDGEQATCTAELPFTTERQPSCSTDEISLSPWRTTYDGEQEWPSVIALYSTPRNVEVVVSREGTEIGRSSFKPSYVKTEPNGEGCGICKNAAATMAF